MPGTRDHDDVRHELPMLLIALAILVVAWIGAAIVVVGLCASAAAGDRALTRTATRAPATQPEAAQLLRIA
jgi:hypothetical protein